MADLISRQAAIDAPFKKFDMATGVTWIPLEYIEKLPSAQPEIIHCKECKYGVQDEDKRWYCRGLGCQIGNEDGSGYCADALNRKEGAKDD